MTYIDDFQIFRLSDGRALKTMRLKRLLLKLTYRTYMKTNEKIKAVPYCRVSSKEQEETGYSLPAQEKLIQEYGDRKDMIMDKIFSIAESASGAKQRKVFDEMMQYVVDNEVNILLCEKVDRITRNFKEAIVINDWLEADPNRQIHFVKQNLVIHQNAKSDEKFRWDIEIVLAKKYISNLSEEVKKGQAEKISQGWLPTTPPLGYKTIGDKGHKIHVIDPDVAPRIKEMFSLYATGNYSTVSLGQKMFEKGFRSRGGGRVVKSKIHKLLCEPFYYGKFVWNGKEYDGKHEPIITRDLFNQVKKKLTRLSAPYHRTHDKELRGKIFCGNCTRTVTWELQKGQWYGACKNCKSQLATNKKYIRQEAVEDLLLARIASVAPKNERVLEVLNKALKESHREEIELHDAQVNGINNSLQRIEQRVRNMYDDKLDGTISASLFNEKTTEFNREKDTLLDNLRKLKQDNAEYYRVGIAIHDLALKAKEIYLSEDASTEERRLLLAYAYSTVSVLGGVITPEYTKGFGFLAKWMPRLNEILEPTVNNENILISLDESENLVSEMSCDLTTPKINSRTQENPYGERQNATFVASHPIMLPG